MKKILHLVALLLFATTIPATASHYLGGEISYQQLSSNAYQVTLKTYRDCAGAGASTTATVNLRAPGCNTGKSIALTLVELKVAKPYGPGIPVICFAAALPNYEIMTYTGNVIFTPSEFACADWVLSWSECCRSDFDNVLQATGSSLYIETKLKLLANLTNSSPAFDTLHAPVMYVNYNKNYFLSMTASDPDGDSLVYSLVAPLSAANTPLTYASFPGWPNVFFQNPNPKPPYSNPFSPQLAQLQGGTPPAYSPTYPMPSLFINWNGPATVPYPNGTGGTVMIWIANHYFNLDSANGGLKFHTSYHSPHPGAGNKYLVSIMVDEYRKINGVITKLSSIRRETYILVFDGSQNLNPLFSSPIANNQPLPEGTEIRLRPGSPLNFQFSASDEDPTDQVYLSTNATYHLPGATFTATSGNQATGNISWTPTAAQARPQPYYFQILVRDNGNSLRGVHVETIAVRVSATGGVTGSKADLPKAEFSAFPNPFSSELNFRLNLKTKAESIIIYNLLGQQVDRISLATIGVGEQKLQWQNAGKFAAGTYVANLVAADRTVQTLKFTKLQ